MTCNCSFAVLSAVDSSNFILTYVTHFFLREERRSKSARFISRLIDTLNCFQSSLVLVRCFIHFGERRWPTWTLDFLSLFFSKVCVIHVYTNRNFHPLTYARYSRQLLCMRNRISRLMCIFSCLSDLSKMNEKFIEHTHTRWRRRIATFFSQCS